MRLITLSIYALRLKTKHSKDNEYLPLDSVHQNTDFFDSVLNFLKKRKDDYEQDEENNKLLRVISSYKVGRTISGRIQTGEYGFESTLFNVETKKISYERQTTDAEMMPFYFLFHLPKKSEEGILILQRTSNLGIADVLTKSLKKFCAVEFPDLTLSINALIPKELASKYLKEGKVLKLSFIKYGIPDDIADAVIARGHIKDVQCTELLVHAKKNRSFGMPKRILDFVDGKKELSEVVEITNFEYDSIRVQINIGGMTRTINLQELSKVRAYYDITDSIELDRNGHPKYESIDSVAKDFLTQTLRQMGK